MSKGECICSAIQWTSEPSLAEMTYGRHFSMEKRDDVFCHLGRLSCVMQLDE
jgi:hypothetical protein